MQRNIWIRSALVGAGIVSVVGCARGPRAVGDPLSGIDGRRVRLVATARMAGELDPCR